MWVRGIGGEVGIFREISENFLKISGEFPVKFVMIRKREIKIVQRQINILIKDLRENNPTIIPDSPVEYRRNGKNHSM